MPLAMTKENLEQLLSNKENKVIALSGDWGTGKSKLWADIKESATDKMLKKSLYASLFGIENISQLKIKILQNKVPRNKWSRLGLRIVGLLPKIAADVGAYFGAQLSSLEDVAEVAMPMMLTKKMIVLDDIERKHANLTIEALLGFIDEFTNVYDTRFVLILNTDQLVDVEIWKTMQEKIIDHEVSLNTTPEEAFDLALKTTAPAREDVARMIKKATATCNVNNIRIIRKTIQLVEKIISCNPSVNAEILGRIIPSTVLLSAIHYGGVKNGPTMKYALNFDSCEYSKPRQSDEEESMEANPKWAVLMDRLGVVAADELDGNVADLLCTGIFKKEKFKEAFEKYASEKKQRDAKHLRIKICDAHFWEPNGSDAQTIKLARELLENAHLLDALELSEVAGWIESIAPDVAGDLVKNWVNNFNDTRSNNPSEYYSCENPFGRSIHPQIQAALESAVRSNPISSLFEAWDGIVNGKDRSPKDEEILRAATPGICAAEIKVLSGKDLALFMLGVARIRAGMISRGVQQGNYLEEFSCVFVSACQDVFEEKQDSRIARSIRTAMTSCGLQEMIDSAGFYPRPARQL